MERHGIRTVSLELRIQFLINNFIFRITAIVWSLRPSETDIQLLGRTHQLVKNELMNKPGVECTGWKRNGGLFLAHNNKRMQEYQRLNGLSKYFDIESHILDRTQTIDLLEPLIDRSSSNLVGALFSPNDGFVDPYQYCTALVKGGRLQVFDNCRLIAINTSERTGSGTGVRQQSKIKSVCVQYGDEEDVHEITTSCVVNSTGCWAPLVAKLAGIISLG